MYWETKIPVTHVIAIFTLLWWSGTKSAREAWRAAVHGVTKSQTQLSD